jgi:peptidoglycan hydrolase-like protein with peptidoglycan-binding domain
MQTDCLALSKQTRCSTVKLSGQPDGTVISRSVGASGVNSPADVRTIQDALNGVPTENGGPDPELKVDGIVGPLTLAAIKAFQQAHVRVVDSRIDPNGATLKALNTELDTTPAVAQAAGGNAAKGRRRSDFLPPDPAINAAVLEMLSRTRSAIRAANFQLLTADPFVTTQKLTPPTGPFQASAALSIKILDTVFSLGKFSNPRPSFENIKRVFRNMDVALNRSFETSPLVAPVLFVPNTHIKMEDVAEAYTSMGGAFMTSKVKLAGLGEPADRIYICRNFLTDIPISKVNALVHELAHFVSGQPIKIDDIVKKGTMLRSATRPPFDAISPEQKIRSAEHYAFFAIMSNFPQLMPPNVID